MQPAPTRRAPADGGVARAAARGLLLAVAGALAAALALGCGGRKSLEVTASAYTSSPGETQGDPNEGAWGDRIEPGVKAIAVSRDLLERGLMRGTEVEIEGLSGTYTVLDKMGRRWERKIDIYMGTDRERALEWGRRTVTIHWSPGSAE